MRMNIAAHILLRATTALCLLAATSCVTENPPEADETTLVETGQAAPDFTVGMLDGSEVTLSDLRGRVVLLTFWSAECSVCRAEMAVVQERIIDRFADRPFTYLPVSRGLSRETVEEFCRQNGYTFPVGLDPDRSIYGMYATRYVPRSFLIDADGVIRMSAVEYETDYLDVIAAETEKLLRKIERQNP